MDLRRYLGAKRLLNEDAELLVRTADGAVAKVTLEFQGARASRPTKVTYQALFTRRDGAWPPSARDWRYAGPLSSERRTPSAIIRAHPGVDVGQFVTVTEQVYAQATADLGLTPMLPVVLELYDDASLFRALAPRSVSDDAPGWTAPGGAIHFLADGRPLDVALQRATGVRMTAFQEAWMAATALGLIPQRFIETAQQVDPARVPRAVATLTSDEYRGHPASSPEADAVAAYLADELARLGLQPAGDDGTFFQTVPLSGTLLTGAPTWSSSMTKVAWPGSSPTARTSWSAWEG